jgi:hypothetical protein
MSNKSNKICRGVAASVSIVSTSLKKWNKLVVHLCGQISHRKERWGT